MRAPCAHVLRPGWHWLCQCVGASPWLLIGRVRLRFSLAQESATRFRLRAQARVRRYLIETDNLFFDTDLSVAAPNGGRFEASGHRCLLGRRGAGGIDLESRQQLAHFFRLRVGQVGCLVRVLGHIE